MRLQDWAYWRACQDARDDAHYLGIRCTQAEVEIRAEEYRTVGQRN